jgi:Tfp pilus assembly protein PilX
MTASEGRRRPHDLARRGAAAAVAVIALGLVNLLVIGAVRPGPQEHQLALERVQAARALAAAESGVRLLIDLIERGEALPAEGETLTLTDASCEFVAVPEDGTGEVMIEGRCGSCRRRVSVLLQ